MPVQMRLLLYLTTSSWKLNPDFIPHIISLPILGLQDAFDPVAGNPSSDSTADIIVFRDVCWIPIDAKFVDYSRACTKPDLISSNTSRLHNCVVYPAISQYPLVVEQNEPVDNPFASSVQGLK